MEQSAFTREQVEEIVRQTLENKTKQPKLSKRNLVKRICDYTHAIKSTSGLAYIWTEESMYPIMLVSEEGEELIRDIGRTQLEIELMSNEVTEITKSLQSKSSRSQLIRVEPRVIYDPTTNTVLHDLNNGEYTCVRINAVEPSIESLAASSLFHRTNSTQPLPKPDFNGTIADLEEGFEFVESKVKRDLLIAYAMLSFSPFKERMPLYVWGDTQSGKSTACKNIAFLIDPQTQDYANAEFSFTKRIRDLMAAAVDQYLLVFGNEDNTPSELANELCKRATGGATIECKLYRQGVSFKLEAIRGVLINALHPPEVRPDLLKRFLVIQLTGVSEETWKEPSEAEVRFMALRPRMLGAMYKAVSTGLSRFRTIPSYPNLGRHSEFCRWVVASSREFGWADDYFPRILREHNEGMLDTAANSLELGEALKKVIRGMTRSETGVLRASYSEMCEYIGEFDSSYRLGGRLSPGMLRNDLKDYQSQLFRSGVLFVRNTGKIKGYPVSTYALLSSRTNVDALRKLEDTLSENEAPRSRT